MSKARDKKFLTAVGSVLVAVIGYSSSLTVTMYKDRQALEARVYDLERIASEQMKLKLEADLVSYKLKYQLEQSFKTIDVIQAYIDAMPFPAWIKKRLASGEFEMMIINRAYAIAFDITKEQYQGKTDADIWPFDISQMYKKLDQKVYDSKKAHCERETVIKKDEARSKVLVCKFPIKIDGQKYGVGGVIVE